MKSLKLFFAVGLLLICTYPVCATSPRSKYDAFKAKATRSYNEFRKEANRRYADFIRQAWDEYSLDSIVEQPEPDYIVPEVYIEDGDSAIVTSIDVIMADDETNSFQEVIASGFNKVKKGVSKLARRLTGSHEIPNPTQLAVPDKAPIAKPQPIGPVEVVPDLEYVQQPFTFFGTECKVSIPKTHNLDLKKVSNKNVADMWTRLSQDDFAMTLKDCLNLRDSLNLNDWCYLKMLDALGNAIYGDTNEGRLFTTYMLAQSGYSVRLEKTNNRLGMLYSPTHILYNQSGYEDKQKIFYPYNYKAPDQIEFVHRRSYVNHGFENELDFSMQYSDNPKLAIKESAPRHIKSLKYPHVECDITVNENLIEFYNSYPDGFRDPNRLTRYSSRANIELDSLTKEKLYPILSEKLKGMNKVDATNALLNLVQTSLDYEFDNVVWGADRVFFAEETLFYPYCDCEDHAILFSRLVRDLVGLDVALVHYPGHLATAVCFGDEDVPGDFFKTNDGKKYIICDPTYKTATAGMQMPKIDATQLQFIEL